jgi:hypothetical protein
MNFRKVRNSKGLGMENSFPWVEMNAEMHSVALLAAEMLIVNAMNGAPGYETDFPAMRT